MHTRIITNGDSLLGYAVAFKFLTASKSESYKYRIFCREKQTLKELELLGAEVIETDYKDVSNSDLPTCHPHYSFIKTALINITYIQTVW